MNILLIYWSTTLKLAIQNILDVFYFFQFCGWYFFKDLYFGFFEWHAANILKVWIHPVTAKIKLCLTEKHEKSGSNLVKILCESALTQVQGKVTTLVWPLHTGQISPDICWTATYLTRQMKMETRMIDVNRLYLSPCHRSLPPKEIRGILTPSMRLPWQYGHSVKVMLTTFFCSKLGKYQCNQMFALLLTHMVQRLHHKCSEFVALLGCIFERINCIMAALRSL